MERTALEGLAIDSDLVCLIWLDDQSVKRSGLGNTSSWRAGKVLLLVLASLWVLVAEDEVDLVCCTTLVWAKHDDIW